MSKPALLNCLILACLLIAPSLSAVAVRCASSPSTEVPSAKVRCTKLPKCANPVLFVGDKDGCACFACRYKTRKQYEVCTDNKSYAKKLKARAIDSGEERYPGGAVSANANVSSTQNKYKFANKNMK